MNIKVSGRSALIIAAGLWLGFAGPMRVTDSAAEPAGHAAQTEKAGAPVKLNKFTKHRSHKRHIARTRKSTKAASKKDSASEKDTGSKKTADASAPSSGDKQMPLPPAVANANAQMPGIAAEAPKTEAGALANSAGRLLATNANQADAAQPQADIPPEAAAPATTAAADVVPADELNDVDRAMSNDKPATPTLALASIDTPASATDATGQASDDSTWNQTSLIGKIFIAFGGLLTLASAARMFIA
jgi:hypothetical protein